MVTVAQRDKSDHLWPVPCLQLFDGEVDGVERVSPVRRRHRDHDARLGHPHDADPEGSYGHLETVSTINVVLCTEMRFILCRSC